MWLYVWLVVVVVIAIEFQIEHGYSWGSLAAILITGYVLRRLV